ncbi:MAG: DNA topoisomerase IV subunit A [Alphaproteobacteria bacterium]|nr:DNA topoisomerase IV subunit A [Alphaproteobacteria bacterium]
MTTRTANRQNPPEPPAAIVEQPLAKALSERYLSYALSTITARSLPDVRDGLKPVHRRLLYAMRELKLEPNLPPKKSARVVGDVMGKFHPHGDSAIYDAMVRMAQDFAQRYPLVEGQGNFGNIDGDNAAAMRYTEARLTEVAKSLLEGIGEDAVDLRPTYDGLEVEPVVLPSAFPNLLANGASGIAVGMATSIPPHNVSEICDALRYLIAHPSAKTDKLVSFIQGPDFPTGGILAEDRAAIVTAYETGRGSFRVRARWEKEELKGGAWRIIVTEMPYQVPKARLIEKIATLLGERKLPLLDDISDESAEDVRIVLVPKSRNVDPAVLMESLFRATELESKFPLNMNVLDAQGIPRVMTLPDVLRAFLDHRQVVLVRRSQHKLAGIEARLEILAGLLIAYLNLDEVIRIIRTEDEPKPVLMRRFGLTENQTEAILNMRLRSLRKLEEMEIKREEKDLAAARKELKRLLSDESARWEAIDGEIAAIKQQFGKSTALGKRRTDIAGAPDETIVPVEAVIERELMTVICSHKGWIRAQKGQIAEDKSAREAIKYKEGDSEAFVLNSATTDKILLFASNGRFYTLGVDKLPGGRGFGEPVRLLLEMGQEAEILALYPYDEGAKFLVAAEDGRGFVVPAAEVLAQTRNGKQVVNLDDTGRAIVCVPVVGDHVAVIGTNRKMLIFPLKDLPEMGRGRGVMLQKYSGGALSDAKCFTLKEGLSWKSGERERNETNLREWLGERAQTGRLPPTGFPKSNRFQ